MQVLAPSYSLGTWFNGWKDAVGWDHAAGWEHESELLWEVDIMVW